MNKHQQNILKPCPFCGGMISIRWDEYYRAPIIEHEDYKVNCITDNNVFYGFSMDKVIEMWNKRSENKTSCNL